MKALADQLLNRIARAGRWPLPDELKVAKRLKTWQAFRDSDRDALKHVAGWPLQGREYKIDPLAPRIAKAWAAYLWGADPEITPASPRDQTALDEMLDAQDLTAELYRGKDICTSEGETWARIHVDLRSAEHPLLEFRSRGDVIPLYQGTRLLAAAVVDTLDNAGRGANQHTVWRHFEVHTVGRLENVLYRGTKSSLGQLVSLSAHPETIDLVDVWDHGLPDMLLERIPNELGRDPRLGVSEFTAIADELLDLNEARTIGSENMRLTAKKRVVVPASSVRPHTATGPGTQELVDRGDGVMLPANPGGFDAGEDVLIADPLDRELGRDSQPFRVLEYSFDAEALIAYQRDTAEVALTRLGLTPQWLGIATGEGYGFAATGTALRLRMVPTDIAGGPHARPWDRSIPRRLQLMILLDQLPTSRGGFGRTWQDTTLPSLERGDAIPIDVVEEDRRHADNVTAGIESVETSIRERHPDWDDKQVADELDRIHEDKASSAPALFGGGAPPEPPPGPEPPPEPAPAPAPEPAAQ